MSKELKKPADVSDVENHQAVKFALKALWYRKQQARRDHCMAVAAIDAIFRELRDALAVTPLEERVALIAHYEKQLDPFFC
jgi:hypothetical protein